MTDRREVSIDEKASDFYTCAIGGLARCGMNRASCKVPGVRSPGLEVTVVAGFVGDGLTALPTDRDGGIRRHPMLYLASPALHKCVAVISARE